MNLRELIFQSALRHASEDRRSRVADSDINNLNCNVIVDFRITIVLPAGQALMRITVPTIPKALLSSCTSSPQVTPAEAVERIAAFLAPGNVTVLSGAGVSVDSGIRAYRGKDGRYMNPNYKCVFKATGLS